MVLVIKWEHAKQIFSPIPSCQFITLDIMTFPWSILNYTIYTPYRWLHLELEVKWTLLNNTNWTDFTVFLQPRITYTLTYLLLLGSSNTVVPWRLKETLVNSAIYFVLLSRAFFLYPKKNIGLKYWRKMKKPNWV